MTGPISTSPISTTPTSTTPAPPAPLDDELARQAIAHRLDATLFVEAGAGTGKTTALVGRIVELVATGRAKLSEIAAITFTEAAAAELRDRVTESLEHLAATARPDVPDPAATNAAAANAAAALAEVDGAAISTLHAFARRVLSEHPFEVGLPPVIEVFDPVRSAVAFDERWGAFVEGLLMDPEIERAVLLILTCGGGIDHLRAIARQLDQQWDLTLDADLVRPALSVIDPTTVVTALRGAQELSEFCRDPEDNMALRLAGLERFVAELASAADEFEVLRLLATSKTLAYTKGRAGNWDGHLPEVRERLVEAEEARITVVSKVVAEALGQLLVELRALTLRAAEARRREGRLEYHDLLVLARQLVRDRPEAAAALGARYRFLLIDEFQDTDPIQAELALRIASEDPSAGSKHWSDLSFEPGRVFFVGDPKQSIYRFRRADIGLYLATSERPGVEPVTLSRNFRSVPGVLAWVNAVFGDLIGEGEPGLQPAFQPLAPTRDPQPGGDAGPPVVLLGGEVDLDGGIRAVRARESADIAWAIRQVCAQGWPVGKDGRAADFSDVTILVPTKASVPALQAALEAADVPYRLEVSSLVYNSSEVRDLLTVLRAIDDPTDAVAVVAALRSPLFGCGDDDLVTFRLDGGHWDYRRPGPRSLGADHPVVAAQAALARLHERRWWVEVSALVAEVLVDRRAWELSLDARRPRDAWRRLRFVLDQARQFADVFGGDLRRYLAWADLQSADDARVTEVVLPELDYKAVRIMTVHAAKGLEFPVVVLAGLQATPRTRSGPEILWGPDGPEVVLTKDLKTPGYDELEDHEKLAGRSERLRLLYVAATRAQDYLIVGLAHKPEREPSTHAALLEQVCGAHPDLWRRLEDWSPRPAGADRGPDEPVAPDSAAARSAWEAEHRALLEADTRSRVLAATTVAKMAHQRTKGGGLAVEDPGLADDDPAGELPAWRRGRAGTSVGRAVHAVLQSIDLATGADLESLAKAYAAAEGVTGQVREIMGLVSTALASETLTQVAGRRYWKELYVGAPVEGRVLEGFLDLLVEGPEGLEIVDYKTDQAATEGDLDRARDRYRLQGAAYAVAVEAAIGTPVVACTFLFLRTDIAVPRRIDDLPAAMAEVRQLLAAD